MKKRIMHILSSSKYSGAENVATTIIENTGDSYEVIYVSPQGPIEKALQNKGIQYLGIKSMSLYNVRKAIKYWKPDIIHAHDFRASMISSLSTVFIPVISHIHQNPDWLSRFNLKSILFSIFCLKYKKIVTVTNSIYTENNLLRNFSDKIVILKNIVNIANVRKKSRFDLPEYYDVAFLGRLEDVKNPVRFINIVEKIVSIDPKFKAVMIGDGSLKTVCEKEIDKKKLNNSIIMKGFLSNPYPYLMNSNLLILTSKSEGRPMAALEAMALGKPVITSAFDGVEKLINDSNGIICYNDQEFVKSILYLTSNKKIYNEFSKSVVQYAENNLDITSYIKSINRIYSEILE